MWINKAKNQSCVDSNKGDYMRRVVVTGMGAITPVGIGVESFWENIKKIHK